MRNCDWEQRKLGELASFSKGAGYTKGDLTAAGKPIILYGRLYTKYETVIENVDTFVDEKEKSVISAGNEVIVPASGETSEDISRASVVAKAGIILGGDLNIVKPNTEIDPAFLALTISNGRQQKELSKKAQGKSVVHLHNSDLKEVDLVYPQKEEQSKIGIFFKHLDDTIALHLCKQRQLELLKQRLIKEILPQSDSTLPHLRFANFRKPWEQHQLKEVLKVNSGRDYKHLNEGNIPVYGTGGYMLSVDGKLSDVDGIGLGRKGTIDKPQYLKAPFWTVDTLFYLTPSPNYDIYFLYTLIQNVNWKSMDESTGVPSLSKSVIERVTLTFPILEEQQKIGSFFREFDNTISLHQQKIAHLKALKSTILNKMFI